MNGGMAPWELQRLKRAPVWLAGLLASALRGTRSSVSACTRSGSRGRRPEGPDAEVPGNRMAIHHVNESCHFVYKKKKKKISESFPLDAVF